MRQKISAHVDGGLSGSVAGTDTGVRTPFGVSGILFLFLFLTPLLFSQKGLRYDFEILPELLNNKNIRIPMKK